MPDPVMNGLSDELHAGFDRLADKMARAVGVDPACRNCRYSFRPVAGAAMHCRRNPPVIAVLIVQNALGQPHQTVQSVFPMVEPTWECGAYETRDPA